MIKPNELRIGNYLSEGRVIEIGENYFRIESKTDYIDKIEGAERRLHVSAVELRAEGDEEFFEGYAAVYNKAMSTFHSNCIDITPIPLTSEWLLKFGFEKTTGLTWSFSYEKTYSVYRKSGLAHNETKVEWWYDGILLKKQPDSVHELQNLYYALTGEELTIQE